MKTFYPDFFIRMSRIIEAATWNAWFKRICPPAFIGLFSRRALKEIEVMNEGTKSGIDELLKILEKDCLEVELTTSRATIQKMHLFLTQVDCRYLEFGDLATELRDRLIDEMTGKLFFSLTLREAEYYMKPWKGWEEIIVRFPDTISDIEEAGKCFALNRYPATVFHSLQVIEFGLLELGKFIGVSDPKSGWTSVTGTLKKIVEKKYPDRTDFEKQHSSFLEQVQGTAEALKNAWRNKISHAQGRLVLLSADFNAEIAEEILIASRAFMRRLATEMP